MATATTTTTKKKSTKKKKKAATPVNGFFNYAERGGTFSGEIVAGIAMGVLAVCGMFINMQLVAQMSVTAYTDSSVSQVATNGEVYAMTWLASMVVATIGTLLTGLVARLPLVQVTSLSLSTVLISTATINSGLTYYNMLAITFVSNVIYLIIAAVPQLRRFVYSALPASVRAALPAATGLLMAWVAAQLTGVFNTETIIPNYGTGSLYGTGYAATSGLTANITDFSYSTDSYYPQLLLSMLAVILAVVVYLICRPKKSGVSSALLWGTLFFLIASVLCCGVNWNNFSMTFSFMWGRLWMVGGEDAMTFHLSAAFGNLAIGKVFTQGFDFSGFTAEGGNIALVFASTALSYVFLFLYDADSTMVAVANETGEDAPDADKAAMPLILNGVTNVIATAIGCAPIALGKESVAGAENKGRSGLSSVVAAIVFAISAVVWVVPFLMATIVSYNIQFSLYGHYGYCMQLMCETSFAVADAVMMMVGLSMAVKSFTIDVHDVKQAAPFITTVAATFLFSNLACGVAAGTVAHVLVNVTAPRRRKGQPKVGFVERVGGVPVLVWAVVSVVLLVLVML